MVGYHLADDTYVWACAVKPSMKLNRVETGDVTEIAPEDLLVCDS